jgi:hypothetical protein
LELEQWQRLSLWEAKLRRRLSMDLTQRRLPGMEAKK